MSKYTLQRITLEFYENNMKAKIDDGDFELDPIRLKQLARVGLSTLKIVHDFRNLLTPVLSMADLLLSQIDNPHFKKEEMRSSLEIMASEAKKSVTLITLLSRFGAGDKYDLRYGHIEDIVDAAKSELGSMFASNGNPISLKYDLIPTRQIECDPLAIERVIQNLVANARDAIVSKGTGNGEVSIASRNVCYSLPFKNDYKSVPASSYVRLDVKDNGIGLDSEALKRIRQNALFFSTKSSSGTGLGLASAIQTLERHGGYLSIETKVGEGSGSTFGLHFPFARMLLSA